jgi:hypothetical protein
MGNYFLAISNPDLVLQDQNFVQLFKAVASNKRQEVEPMLSNYLIHLSSLAFEEKIKETLEDFPDITKSWEIYSRINDNDFKFLEAEKSKKKTIKRVKRKQTKKK